MTHVRLCVGPDLPDLNLERPLGAAFEHVVQVTTAYILHLESPESIEIIRTPIDDEPGGDTMSIVVVITSLDQPGVDPELVAAYVAENLNNCLHEHHTKYGVSMRVTVELVRSGSVRYN